MVLWVTKCLLPAAGSRVVMASSAAGAGTQRSQLSFLGPHRNEEKNGFYIKLRVSFWCQLSSIQRIH